MLKARRRNVNYTEGTSNVKSTLCCYYTQTNTHTHTKQNKTKQNKIGIYVGLT